MGSSDVELCDSVARCYVWWQAEKLAEDQRKAERRGRGGGVVEPYLLGTRFLWPCCATPGTSGVVVVVQVLRACEKV